MRPAVLILLAVITGFALGAGVTVWGIRESESGHLGFVSTKTTATLLAHQERELKAQLSTAATGSENPQTGEPNAAQSDQLAALKATVGQLTSQIAAMNRDLASLRFRVDTHSDSFRPLIQNDTESRIRPATQTP